MSRVISVSASAPGVGAAVLVGVAVLGERVLVDVGGGALAPGQGVEPGRVQVGEQRRGPAAAVEPDQHPAVVADEWRAARGSTGAARRPARRPVRPSPPAADPRRHRTPRFPPWPGRGTSTAAHGFSRSCGCPDRRAHARRRSSTAACSGRACDMTARHRGDPVAGLARLGEQPDLAADRLDLRRPVQTQHPPQRDRVDPGRALRAGLTQQGAEHALAQHRIQRVEPVRQLTVDGVRGLEQPGARQRGHRQQQPRQRRPRAPR